MLTENKVLMEQARASLKGKWGIAVAAAVIYMVIHILSGSIDAIGWIIGLVISGPLGVGYYRFFLSIGRSQEVKLEQLFDGFRTSFLNSFVAWLLVCVFVILWALLLIVPGIIAAISYSMTFLIIAEDPRIDAYKAIQKSKELMMGHKKKFFYLGCRFLGWIALGILSLGIGFLWILSYMTASVTLFYRDLTEPKAATAVPVA